MGGVLSSMGCSKRAPPRSTPSEYVYTASGSVIWEMSGNADFVAAGSPQSGDAVTLADLEKHAAGGNTTEVLLKNGFIAPIGKNERSMLPASGYVYTASMVDDWALHTAAAYKRFGSPQAGDPVLQAELDLHTGFGMGMPLDMHLTLGKFARPGAKFIHKLYMPEADLDEWADSTREEPREPLWPSIDPHHHLWDRPPPELTQVPPFLMHSFGPKQPGSNYPYASLVEDLKGNAVVGTVFVECGSEYKNHWPMSDPLTSLPESKWVQAIADKGAVPMAIVAHFDLSQGREATERAVAAHRASAPNLVGVRHSLAWHRDAPVFSRKLEGQPEALSRMPAFREGMEVLAAHGLSYDAWLFYHNLEELTELARACPNTTIVCDHVGGPLGTEAAGFSLQELVPDWEAKMAELATCENVHVKLSGLSMPSAGFGFELREKPPSSSVLAEAYQPFFAHCLEVFGAHRCFFASNFPVDKASGSFTTLWNSFKRMAAALLPGDEAAQRALFYDNAVRVYRLDKPPFSLPPTSAEAEAAEGLARY